jgi:hypothetical protein
MQGPGLRTPTPGEFTSRGPRNDTSGPGAPEPCGPDGESSLGGATFHAGGALTAVLGRPVPTTNASRPLVALLVFAGTLLVYLLTLYSTVAGGDAGELVVAAHGLHVAHPPGYPLYTLLAHLFSWLPVASVAWRVNLLSAVCAAATSALVYRTVIEAAAPTTKAERSSATAAGVFAAGLHAFAASTWLYAVTTEVFALHGLFVAASFLLALRWSRAHGAGTARLLAIVLGLGLANHQTLLFYAVPIVAWMLWAGGRVFRRPQNLLILAGCGLLGLCPYAWLAVAGRDATVLSWGDTSTPVGWLDHVLRRDYGTFRLAAEGFPGTFDFAAQLRAWAAHTARATLGIGLVLAVIAAASAVVGGVTVAAAGTVTGAVTGRVTGTVAGTVTGARRLLLRFAPKHTTAETIEGTATRSWVRLLVASLVFYIGVFHALANLPADDPLLLGVLARFWLQADLLVCVLAGIGFTVLAARLGHRRAAASWTLAALLVAMRVRLSVGEPAGGGDGLVERYGRALLAPLPANALLLTRGDLATNVLRYLQACEDLRPDVVVLDQELLTKEWFTGRAARAYPDIVFPGRLYHPREPGGFTMRAFLDANVGRREVFVLSGWKPGDDSTRESYDTSPMGLAFAVTPHAAPLSSAEWSVTSAGFLAELDREAWPAMDSQARGTWERVVLDEVWEARHRRAWFLFDAASHEGDHRGMLSAARAGFEEAERSHPHPPWYLYKNLGLVYERLAVADPALRADQLAAWRRYLELAPANERDRHAVAEVVAGLEQPIGPARPPASADAAR